MELSSKCFFGLRSLGGVYSKAVAGLAWLDDVERETFLCCPVPGALIWLEPLAEDSSPRPLASSYCN